MNTIRRGKIFAAVALPFFACLGATGALAFTSAIVATTVLTVGVCGVLGVASLNFFAPARFLLRVRLQSGDNQPAVQLFAQCLLIGVHVAIAYFASR